MPGKENEEKTEYFPIQLIGRAATDGNEIETGLDVKIEGFLQIETTVGKDSKPIERFELVGKKVVLIT